MSTATVVQLLDAAIQLISTPDAWMKGDYCNGAVGCNDSTRWSLEGAVMEAANMDQVRLFTVADTAFNLVIVTLGNLCGGKPLDTDAPDVLNQALGRVATFNDLPETTYEKARDLLDRAIAELSFSHAPSVSP